MSVTDPSVEPADDQGEADDKPLELLFGGSLVEQLGAQLYPSATATVAELISNAWDADATCVWVRMPFDDWGADATIEVIDNGHGMNRVQVRHYLEVGRKRRLNDKGFSEGGRPVHGRQGLGKLAAFGTAGWLECTTHRAGAPTIAFSKDYDAIRKNAPDTPYPVQELDAVDALVDPETGDPLLHGTRIRLSKLRQKRRSGEDQFFMSMSRRFAVDEDDLKVKINCKSRAGCSGG
jgi:HSP90 family molecular chaperone